MLRPAPLLALAAVSACLCCCVSPPEWQMHPKFERRMVKVGGAVELKCHPQWKYGLLDGFKKHKLMWTFQKCGEHYSQYPCPQFLEENQESQPLLLCGKKLCRGNLQLINVSLANSGMYQCLYPIGNKTTSTKTVVAYILEVVETAQRPLILDVFPENVTVVEGSQAMFSCKALSNVFAEFHWVRKYDNNSTSQVITYGKDAYESVNSSGQVAVSKDIYIGKLILPAAQQRDSRDYACVVANTRGFVYREVHLTVLPRNYNGPDFRRGVDSSIHFLFLIPIIMLLLPIVVWLVYKHWRRRKRTEAGVQMITNSMAAQHNCKTIEWEQHKDNRSIIKYQIVDLSVENEGVRTTLTESRK